MDEVMTYEEFLQRVKSGIVKGRDLMPVFYATMNWGFKYEHDNEELSAEE